MYTFGKRFGSFWLKYFGVGTAWGPFRYVFVWVCFVMYLFASCVCVCVFLYILLNVCASFVVFVVCAVFVVLHVYISEVKG